MKKTNEECKHCSQMVITPEDARRVYKYKWKTLAVFNNKPDCWDVKKCARKRGYYRNHERSKKLACENHRYLKYKDTECAICKETEGLHVHHIQPQSQWGTDSKHNLLTLCNGCHSTITKYYRILGWS